MATMNAAANQLSSRVAELQGRSIFARCNSVGKVRWAAAAVTGLLKNALAFTVVWSPEAIRVDLVLYPGNGATVQCKTRMRCFDYNRDNSL